MRILVLSDTHGNYPLALKAVEEAGDTDEVVHLGDETHDANILEIIIEKKITKIAGNCDLASSAPREYLTTIAGITIFMTHGDRYLVKSGLARLHEKALQERAQVVLYGHSHLPMIDEINGILFVNPGTLARQSSQKSFAILTLHHGKPTAETRYLTDAQHPQPQL